MKVVAIIQARMGSTRLPGKVMADLCGKPMLLHIIERIKQAQLINEIIVAVPFPSEILQLTDRSWFNPFYPVNAKENDLIGRYYEAASTYNADLIVRICADNPFVDPVEIDRAVQYYMDKPCIFVSNMHQHHKYTTSEPNGYPDGIGCEVFSMSRLKWMNETITDSMLREHPHMIFHNWNKVSSPKCPDEISRPELKLDVNWQDDLAYVRSIYEIVYPKNPQFTTKEVIEAIDTHHLERRTIPA